MIEYATYLGLPFLVLFVVALATAWAQAHDERTPTQAKTGEPHA